MENGTADKIKKATSDVISEIGKDTTQMSSQEKAEHYAIIALIWDIVAIIVQLIVWIIINADEDMMLKTQYLALGDVVFLYLMNHELKWLEPEKRTKALVIGTVAFCLNFLSAPFIMGFVFIALIMIQFVGRIPGRYFFLFDWKKDTVNIQAADALTQSYLSHEHETYPTDHMHKVVIAIYLIFAVGTLLVPLGGIGLFGFPIAVSLGCGLAGYVLRRVIGEQNRNTEIGKSLWRITTLFSIIGYITIIWLIIGVICAIVADVITERNSRYL
ncbi:hypothetical protein [Bilifractor sp. HCP3S3_D3]|uniref:hypothetical protein n=1 Tax=Bilifractor sp. HCP3S3_D3 TaxID=3438907 RepID=UPI003F8AB0AE